MSCYFLFVIIQKHMHSLHTLSHWEFIGQVMWVLSSQKTSVNIGRYLNGITPFFLAYCFTIILIRKLMLIDILLQVCPCDRRGIQPTSGCLFPYLNVQPLLLFIHHCLGNCDRHTMCHYFSLLRNYKQKFFQYQVGILILSSVGV